MWKLDNCWMQCGDTSKSAAMVWFDNSGSSISVGQDSNKHAAVGAHQLRILLLRCSMLANTGAAGHACLPKSALACKCTVSLWIAVATPGSDLLVPNMEWHSPALSTSQDRQLLQQAKRMCRPMTLTTQPAGVIYQLQNAHNLVT